MTWTIDYTLSLAPDTPSMSAARKQGVVNKWLMLQRADNTLWGEIMGSGRRKYQTQIDLIGPAFKCSCPSRKSPCKHGLGLGLIFAQHEDRFQDSMMPEWVDSWISKRRGAEGVAIYDPPLLEEDTEAIKKKAEAKAKRLQKRLEKVTDGVSILQKRLEDLIRLGTKSIEDPYLFWDHVASRLVDAQAGGLARWVRELPGRSSTPIELLRDIGRLHLVCQAWIKRDRLSDDEFADLKSVIGFNVSQEELSEQKGAKDEWLMLSSTTERELNLTVLKQWLWGMNSRQVVVLTSFAIFQQPHPLLLRVGERYVAEACLYPGTNSQRVILKDLMSVYSEMIPISEPPISEPPISEPPISEPLSINLKGSTSLNELRANHTAALAVNPWLTERGYLVHGFQICQAREQWWARSGLGELFLIDHHHFNPWKFLALSDGYPSTVFLIYYGDRLTALALVAQGNVYSLAH